MKRSQQKRIGLAARVLRYMRQSRGISLNEAGKFCQISGSSIAHMEQGRMDIPSDRVEPLVAFYGYTWDQFEEYLAGKEIPLNYHDECFTMVPLLDSDQAKAVYQILVHLVKIPTHRP